MSQPTVRIRVKAPEAPKGSVGGPFICRHMADWCDVQIEITSPNGEKFDLTQVRGIKIDIGDHNALEPIEATLRVIVDELDIECRAALFPEEVPT